MVSIARQQKIANYQSVAGYPGAHEKSGATLVISRENEYNLHYHYVPAPSR
jgi:hypothetical protein